MNIEQIDRYLSGNMDPQERADFELRMHNDSEFRNEVQQYQKAVDALKVYSRTELKERLIKRTELQNRISKGPSYLLWIVLAAAVLILVLWLNREKTNINDPDPVVPATPDTVIRVQPIEEENDTTLNPQNVPQQDTQETRQNNYEELFAMNFKPYTDELLQDQVRSMEVEKTAFELFQQQYVSKQYEAALKTFKTIDASIQKNDNIRFLQANALMAVRKVREASRILKDIIDHNNSRYLAEAYWYLALCYIYEHNEESAMRYLKNTKLSEHKKSKDLLTELENK